MSCQRCKDGLGMYEECVAMPPDKGNFGGVCGNCRRAGFGSTCSCKDHWANGEWVDELPAPMAPKEASSRKSAVGEEQGLQKNVQQLEKYSK